MLKSFLPFLNFLGQAISQKAIKSGTVLMSAVRPESNNSPALTELGSPEVTVCTMLSVLVHLIVLPELIITGFSENDLSPRIAAFFTIVTSFVLELLTKEALEVCFKMFWFHSHAVIVTPRINFQSSYSSIWICLL